MHGRHRRCCLLHFNIEINILAKRGDRFPYRYDSRDSNEHLLARAKHAVDRCSRIVTGDNFRVVQLPRRVFVVQIDKRSLISNILTRASELDRVHEFALQERLEGV